MNSVTKNIVTCRRGKTSLLSAFLLICMSFQAQAQTTDVATETTSYFTNPLFDSLLVIIIVLLAIIAVMAGVVKNASSFYKKQFESKENKSGSGKILGALIALSLISVSAQAADNTGIPKSYIGGVDYGTFFILSMIILVEIIVLLMLIKSLKVLLGTEEEEARVKVAKKFEPKKKTIIEKLNDSVDIDKEADILMDHNYDGIQELDNNLPPWWKIGFYLTIIWAVVYLTHYHISKTGDLQLAEYNKELVVAEQQKAELMKNAANSVDESTVKLLTDPAEIGSGKEVFMSNCVACHGKLGEGAVGPNLTDDFWLHKGGIQDIFKTIKYGWVDKGMKSWKEDLSPVQIAQVSSYIKTLRGTNPPNGKAAQGDLYTENAALAGDSSAVAKPDSLFILKVDSLRKDSALKAGKK